MWFPMGVDVYPSANLAEVLSGIDAYLDHISSEMLDLVLTDEEFARALEAV